MVRFTRQENLIIKQPLPEAGVVCSNPQRYRRLVERFLEHPQRHTDSWGIEVQTGTYRGQDVFLAAVPMGAGGSGFAFLEMFAAGAVYLVRYGSNDLQVTPQQLRDICIVDEADNLYGLLRGSGEPEASLRRSLFASPVLVEALKAQASRLNYPVKWALCHHLEDYHGFNFPDCAGEAGERIRAYFQALDQGRIKTSVCDMETAALLWRAEQFQTHGVTVLQSLIKHRGENTPYDGHYGEIAVEMEQTFETLILDSLLTVVDSAQATGR